MDLKFFRVFRPEDVQRLSDILEKSGVVMYRAWRSGGVVCASPEAIKPRYLVVDGSGQVAIQDPLLSHPSTPHLTPLGQVDIEKKDWHRATCALYRQWCDMSAPAPELPTTPAPPDVAVPKVRQVPGPKPTLTPAATPEAPSDYAWFPATSHVGAIPGLEVTCMGGVRWKDGRPVKWDLTRPSRIRTGGRHQDLHLPDLILCTFVGPPPTPKARATYKDISLKGTVRHWAASNLKWSDLRPSRPTLTEDQVVRVFTDFGTGLTSGRIATAMHVASTTVSAVLRGLTHPERDDLRRECLAERKKRHVPDDSISKYMKRRLAL